MSFLIEQTAYSFFGVSPRASPYEIDQAYRRLVHRYPADRIWDTPMGSVAKTGLQEVERWYALISTSEARAAYDQMLAEKDKPAMSLDGHVGQTENGGSSTNDETSAPETDSSVNDSLGEQDSIEKRDTDDNMVSNDSADVSDDDDDRKSTLLPTDASTLATIETLTAATPSSYLYRTRTRTLIALFVIWLGIRIIVYGTPSTWTLPAQVSTPSPYATLGLPDDTALTPRQIRTAYHRAVLSHHPDKRRGDESTIVDINAAYEAVRGPYQRCLYERAQWLCAHLRQADEVDAILETTETTPGSVSTIQAAQVAVVRSLHSLWQSLWQVLAEWLGRMAGC